MVDTRIRHVTVPGLRLHLRKGDPAMLWVNGQNLLLVNSTAADFIEAFIDVMSRYPGSMDVDRFKQDIVDQMRQKYSQAPADVLLRDFDRIYGTLLDVAKGSCPISDLKLDAREVNPRTWTAPPRMDLGITYRCNNNCYYCYTGGPQKLPELETASWEKAIDILWENGVPQVVFTGGEPTLRSDLVELVDYAKEFVTGLITNGRKLRQLAPDLKRVDLDYVQVSLESSVSEVHDGMVGVNGAWKETVDGIRAAVASGLEVITNTTLTIDNIGVFPDLVRSGPGLGLKIMACNTLLCSGRGTCARKTDAVPLKKMKKTLAKAREAAEKAGVRLEWYSPTCYRQFNPIAAGFGSKSCSAAQYNMTVEPDGSVIPCQSWLKDKVGNILSDPWVNIWNHPISVGLREKKYLEDREECKGCEYLAECCGGCPLEYSS